MRMLITSLQKLVTRVFPLKFWWLLPAWRPSEQKRSCLKPPNAEAQQSLTLHSGQTQKATSLPVFKTSKIWSSSNIYEREVHMKTIQKISRQNEFHAGKTCGWQLLHFQHILKQSEKFKFQKWRYVSRLKWSFPDLCLLFFIKLWRKLCTRRAFDCCELEPFTAVKHKKQRHFRFFRALKFESVQTLTRAINQISRR